MYAFRGTRIANSPVITYLLILDILADNTALFQYFSELILHYTKRPTSKIRYLCVRMRVRLVSLGI